MMIKLSETARDAMLDALASMMDGGRIELLTGDGRLLAVLDLSYPAADVIDGELEFNQIEKEDVTRARGSALEARVIAADGSEVFVCDVGDENSDAVVKLNSTNIDPGGTVELRSFKLVMP